MSRTENIKEKANKTAARFNQVKDQLRVRSHLFGMEMRETSEKLGDQLDKIQKKIVDFSQEAETTSEELRLKTHLGVLEAKEQLEELREDLGAIVKSSKDKLDQGFDEARLKAHLAKMDAKDYLAAKKTGWRDDIETHEKERIHQKLDEIREIIDGL